MRPMRRLLAVIATLSALPLAGCVTAAPDIAAPAVKQSSVSIPMPDGTAGALLFVPAGAASGSAVIVYPDLTGLRPAYAKIGEELARQGHVVLVVNAFYRSASLDGSAATALPRLAFGEAMQRAAPMRAAASDEAVIADARAIVAFLDAMPQLAANAKIAVLGYDIGGAHAFLAARALPDRIAAVAAIHPLSIATTRDTSPHLFVAQSKAAYLVEIAAPDDAREPEDKGDLAKAFATAGLSGSVNVVEAGHGYALPDDPAYDAAAAALSWQRVTALFDAAL